eukprot:s94_g21.t1
MLGAAALLGGVSFVSAPASGNLRATSSAFFDRVRKSSFSASNGQRSQATASHASAAPRVEVPASSKTTSLALAGVAMAALAAGGRKALVNVKPHLVTMTAFENELGVQAPVGFWDPAGAVSLSHPFGFCMDA